uniref:RRM domain-containing protein n=1 Tax=Daucus carota subsp. sativus TaxID=79200 RepID=A0A166CS71_DAUCS
MRREKSEFRNSNFKISNEQPGDDRNSREGQWFRISRHPTTGKRVIVPDNGATSGQQHTAYGDYGREQTYAQVLTGSVPARRKEPCSEDPIKQKITRNGCLSVMINNLPEHTNIREMWLRFNGKRYIKKNVLPRKKDKFNKRFGFLIVAKLSEAQELITDFNGRWMGSNKLVVYLARDSHRRVQASPTWKWSGRQELESVDGKLSQNKHYVKEVKSNRVPNIDKEKVDLVKQPSFRTVQGTITPNCSKLLNRSFIGTTAETVQEDVLQEKILNRGFTFIQVRHLSDKTFLISYILDEDKDLEIDGIKDMFTSFKKVEDSDLVLPRTTWILCDGLPLSAWNKETWELILGDWGSLVSTFPENMEMFNKHNRMVCITTWKVIPIEETLKVMVRGLGYWVKIKETNIVVWGHDLGQRHKEPESASQTSSQLPESEKEVSRSSNQSIENSFHPEEQSSYILDMQDNRRPKSQSNDLSARDHILHLDQWEYGKWNLREPADNSSSDSSKRQDGLFSACMNKAYDLAEVEEVRGDEIYFFGPQEQLDTQFVTSMSQVNLGKKVGRPRKKVEFRNVFDIKSFKKRKRKNTKVQSDKLVKAFKSPDKRGKRKMAQEPSHKPGGVQLLESGKDMTSQILETAEMMGLVLQEDRQQAYEKIQKMVLES